jgi:ribonucleoside-diphosphate reductase alpha chain
MIPKLPKELLEEMPPLSENSRTVLEKRYLDRDEKGQVKENFDELFWRVAYHVASKGCLKAESSEAIAEAAITYFRLIRSGNFLPNSPTLANAGTRTGQLSACFVIPVSDSFSNGNDGIYDALRKAQLIQQTGGGVGFSFSRLRSKGVLVNTTKGVASGPLSFMDVFDVACDKIKQGGCLTPETLVHTELGVLRLSELVNSSELEYNDLDLQVLTDEGNRKAHAGWNNSVANTLTVALENGATLQGTPNHKVKVMRPNGNREWVRFDELTTEDSVIQVLNPNAHMWGDYQNLNPVTGDYNYPSKTYSFPTQLNEELAWVLGYLWGDGFVSKDGSYRFGFAVTNGSPAGHNLRNFFEKMFGIELKVQQKPDDGSYCLIGHSKQVHDWLKLNGLDKNYSNNLEVPKIVRMSPKTVVSSFISGLLEADGTITENRPALGSSSKQLLADVQVLLATMGIPSKLREATKSEDRYSQNYFGVLRVHSGKGLERFIENIPVLEGSRFELLQHVVVDTGREKAWPIPNMLEALEPILSTTTSSRESYERKQALRYLRGQRMLKASSLELLGIGDDSNYNEYYWKVKSVEESGKTLTLDLCVEDNHTYLANGFVSHNTRRGAQMGILRVDHPDILEFIDYKQDLTKLTNFNVSVAITDKFLKALEEDKEYELVDPNAGKTGVKLLAKDVWNRIISRAHATGEPGVVFIDRMSRHCPTPGLNGAMAYEATNPCGEQPLLPYESCNLGSINLDNMIGYDESGVPFIDEEKLRKTVWEAIYFMDDVVECNEYVKGVPEIRETTLKTRKLGLGIMGHARMLCRLGIGYNTEEGRKVSEAVYAFIDLESKKASVELAKDRGAYAYFMDNLDQSIEFFKNDWAERAASAKQSELFDISEGYLALIPEMEKHGLRNSTTTTIAPTGTISMVADTSGGCEPLFALAFKRWQAETHMVETDKVLLEELNSLFDKKQVEVILDGIESNKGSLQRAIATNYFAKNGLELNSQEKLQKLSQVYVTAGDISPADHVLMQAALQKYCDSAISKTANAPEDFTVEQTAELYDLAIKTGCKGITIYRDNSRQFQPLSVPKAEAKLETVVAEAGCTNCTCQAEKAPRSRPSRVFGLNDRIDTSEGKLYVQVNYDRYGIREVIANLGKGGGVLSSLVESLGRVISVALKHHAPVGDIIQSLRGIRGGSPHGFGPKQTLSIPDAIGKVIAGAPDHIYVSTSEALPDDIEYEITSVVPSTQAKNKTLDPVFDLGHSPECSECGGTLVFSEGCMNCPNCFSSKCS